MQVLLQGEHRRHHGIGAATQGLGDAERPEQSRSPAVQARVGLLRPLGEDARRPELQPGEALQLKGFVQPVQSYTLAAV